MDQTAVKQRANSKRKTYTFDEVYDASLKYFFNDPLPADTWADKYSMRTKEGGFLELTPDDMHDRLAREFARIDHEKYGLDYADRFEIYRDAIDHFSRICPQGSPMMAIGNNHKIMSASNCVVIESPEDSISGIMRAATELAQLMKRRAGVGMDISLLRPEGFTVNNAARTTSGCWSFGELFSFVTRMIAQKGRRGALMITLDVHHPDVMKFATMKKDLTKVTGANISIRLSDEFLIAVENDTTYEQRWPCEGTPVFTQQVSAKEVWDTIVETATETAEPGLIFWDRMVGRLPAHCYPKFKSRSTNPCLPKDTWIHTTKGPKQIRSLIGTRFNAYVDGKVFPSTADGFFPTGEKSVYQVKTNNGYIIKCTDNHPLEKITKKTRYTIDTEWTELKDLKCGDRIKLQNQRGVAWEGEGTADEGYLLGSLLGDGTFGGYSPVSVTKNPYAKLTFWTNTKKYMHGMAASALKECLPARADVGSGSFSSVNATKYDRVSITSVGLKKLADRWGVGRYKQVDNKALETASSEFYRGFISGYFDADGSIQGTQQKGVSARIGSNNLSNLRMVQRMLSRLGIISTIYENRKPEGFYPMPDGKGGNKDYFCKTMHDIVVSNDNLFFFQDLIGFRDPVKAEDLDDKLAAYKRAPNRERFVDAIVEIKELGKEDVYDCTIELAHYFDANGISVHNCSEICLSADDSCRLISINLTGYVSDAFGKPSFDWDFFKQDITTAMQMIDNLVDLELELIDKIQDACDGEEHAMWQRFKESGEQGRRTGLGTHGLADMLAQMNIKYDTEEAQEFCDKLYQTLRDTAYSTSIDLAELRGPFPAWDWEIEKDNEFIQDLPEAIKKRMAKVGRRNISILTQAPTGSVSLLSKCGKFNRHNISSGIEPIFRTNFTRRKKINTHNGNIRVDFTDDLGDRWQNYDVYHGNVLNYMETVWDEKFEDLQDETTQNRLKELFKELPDMFITSDQIDWQSRVKLQGIEQQYIDHSISSTINLPRGTTSDVVSNIYLESWKQGLKGVTVYVDGSRDGVLISGDGDNKIDPTKRPDKIVRLQAPKRPKELLCDIHHHTVKGEKWIAVVGLLEGEPYEMFGGYSDSIHLPKRHRKGKIKRRAQGKYSLHIPDGEDELVIKDMIGTFNDPDIGWTTRLVSTSLRHGTPIEFLTEQLSKDGNIASFNKVLSRVLKKYIKEGTEVKSSACCPKCSSTNLQWQEGCPKCMDCAYTKCN